MTSFKTACGAAALLLASTFAASAAPVPGTGGAWIYDGRLPPSCDVRDIRVRHFDGDGHPESHADHLHLGHGHKWSKRNHKGQPVKPPCYVRRASMQSEPVSAPAPTRNVLSGDLS